MSKTTKTTKKTTTKKTWHGSKWIRPEKRARIYRRDEHRCSYCNRKMRAGFNLTLDHLLPRELGGSNHITNLVTACRSCNSSKRDLSTRKFFATLRSHGVDTDRIRIRIRTITRRQLGK